MAAHVISLKPHSFPIRWLPRASCPRTRKTEAGCPRPPSPEGRDSRSMQTRRDKMSRNKPPDTFPQLQPRLIPKASLRWGSLRPCPSWPGGPADGPPPSRRTHAQYPANAPTPTEADTQKNAWKSPSLVSRRRLAFFPSLHPGIPSHTGGLQIPS